MSLYAIADLHLAMNPDIEDKSMDMFGGPWVNHSTRLRDIWMRLIREDDTVLIPGDISWALKLEEAVPDFDWMRILPGKKIIMKGNHDLWWSSIKKMKALFPDFFFLHNNCYVGEDFIVAGSRGWLCPGSSEFIEETDSKIYKRELMRIKLSLDEAKAVQDDKALIAATHFPPFNEKKEASDITRLFTEYGVKKAVYGHLHGSGGFANAYEGFLDGVEYRLVSFDKLEATPLLVI
jgi:predicted phosphohydrolase